MGHGLTTQFNFKLMNWKDAYPEFLPCALYVNNSLPDTETKSAKSTPVTLMDIWGGKDIRKSWCLSIFLWMRNQPSQWNTLGTCGISLDEILSGAEVTEDGSDFFGCWGIQKSTAHKVPVIYHARKITLEEWRGGKSDTPEPWITCVQSFQSPAGLHAYHASLNELLFPAATCPFHLQMHIHTWLGWTQLAGRPRSPPEQSQVQLSQHNLFTDVHTHLHYMYADFTHTQYPRKWNLPTELLF